VRFESGAEFRQVQMAVDAAELVIGLEHPSAHQRRAMVSSRQRLTFLECSRQISIMDSIGLEGAGRCCGASGCEIDDRWQPAAYGDRRIAVGHQRGNQWLAIHLGEPQDLQSGHDLVTGSVWLVGRERWLPVA
jgi:hypothetical protein